MPDYLDILIEAASESIREGYYRISVDGETCRLSLKEAVLKCRGAPIIAEIKMNSPSTGVIRRVNGVDEILHIAKLIEEAGAAAISILTEPRHFKGDINYIAEVKNIVKIPVMMKDIIIDPVQVDAAAKVGADAVLLIASVFSRGRCKDRLLDMIEYSHSRGLEVLLEVHTEAEFLSAIKTEADLIGINNRDLKTLKVNLNVTGRILHGQKPEGVIVVSESGIKDPGDILFLRESGADAFLIGEAIMRAENIKKKVRGFVEAL